MSGRHTGRQPGSLGRSTAIFAVWTAVSRIAGLAREILAAALFGTQGAINAFVIAYQIPGLLRSLVADSALAAAFIPVFTALQEQGRQREAQRLAGALIGLVGIGLGGIALVAVFLAPWIVPPLAPGLPAPLVDQAVTLAQIMFPIVVLLGLAGVVEAIIQAGGRFGPSAFAPVLWNVVIIVALVIGAQRVPEGDRIYVYAVAVLVGTVVQLVYLLPSLRGTGRLPVSLRLRDSGVRRVLVLMLPVTLGLGLINVNLTVDAFFATLVNHEAPRAIDAAFRIYLLPQGIFSVAIATVLFPTIARQAARRDLDGIRGKIAEGLRTIAFMLLPASAFLLVLSEPVVRLVFQRGEFNAASTALTSEALMFFAIGLAFNGASLLLIRAFFGLQLSWLPTKVALLGVALTAACAAALYRPLGVGGIALATSISSVVTCLVLVALLERRLGGLHRAWVLDGALRSLAASAVSALLAWTAWRVLDEALGRGTPAQLVAMGVAVATATLSYLATAWVLEMSELSTLGRLMRRRPAA